MEPKREVNLQEHQTYGLKRLKVWGLPKLKHFKEKIIGQYVLGDDRRKRRGVRGRRNRKSGEVDPKSCNRNFSTKKRKKEE